MLNWIKENGKYLGFEDGALAYRVFQGDDGWVFEDVQELVVWEGYETAEEAKAGAEADYEKHPSKLNLNDETIFTQEEIDEILGDMLYDERKENELVGW